MNIVDLKPVRGGMLRFNINIDGLLILGFRTTSDFSHVLPPQTVGNNGRIYNAVLLSAEATNRIVGLLKGQQISSPTLLTLNEELERGIMRCSRDGCTTVCADPYIFQAHMNEAHGKTQSVLCPCDLIRQDFETEEACRAHMTSGRHVLPKRAARLAGVRV